MSMHPLRKNILVDFGEVIDQLGASAIVTPDKYKRISNIGKIVAVGDNCSIISKGDVGKKCIVMKWNRDDCRFNPSTSKKMKLKPHWHFVIPEHHVDAILE